MTELQLYKWMQGVEFHLYRNGEEQNNLLSLTDENTPDWKILVMPDFDKLKDFIGLCRYNYFAEDGMPVTLKHGYVVFDLMPLMDYFDIDPKNILS